ncbi:MAG: sigma-54 dependent transcriptional regulator [Marinoscillum sp.]
MRILIVEDDTSFGMMVAQYLNKNNYTTTITKSAREALLAMDKQHFDLVLSDLKLPGIDGIELLQEIKSIDSNQTVVLMTSYGHVKSAVRAMKLGAYEYITKPIDHEELLSVIREGCKQKAPDSKREKQTSKFISGTSEKFKEVLDQAHLVAVTELSVLVLGESGTGKEYLSKLIHDHSDRKHGPFVSVDCGTLSTELAASELFGHVKGAFTSAHNDKTGQFQLANGGTLFLDEIGNLSTEVQVQLLRVLQERKVKKVGSEKSEPVDVRILAATNEDLKNRVRDGHFREDLYHRINEFQIDIPPLRERKEDLKVFIDKFIYESNQEFGKNISDLSPEAREQFMSYHWSGNIRELKNVVRRSVLLEKGSQITLNSLPSFLSNNAPEEVPPTSDLKKANKITEIQLIKDALENTRFNKTKAAKILNIDRTTLYEKLKKYNLEIFGNKP